MDSLCQQRNVCDYKNTLCDSRVLNVGNAKRLTLFGWYILRDSKNGNNQHTDFKIIQKFVIIRTRYVTARYCMLAMRKGWHYLEWYILCDSKTESHNMHSDLKSIQIYKNKKFVIIKHVIWQYAFYVGNVRKLT